MSTTNTTLSGAVALNDLVLNVASATGAAIGNVIRIDDEYMVQSSAAIGTSIPVARRGDQGSAVIAHAKNAVVEMGLASDFGPAPQGAAIPTPVSPVQVRVSFNTVTAGNLSSVIPQSNQGVFLTLYGTVTTAQTITDPTDAQESQVVTIQAGAAQAYLINAKDSAGAVSEVSFSGDQDIATFGGAIGDNFSFKAVNGAWMVLTKTNVTLSDT